MPTVERILDPFPCPTYDDHLAGRSGDAPGLALRAGRDAVVSTVIDSGLRGRGGAGFPTGIKWVSVLRHTSTERPTPIVINAAEGEPGSFKDRELLRRNPYRVIEGALVAARVFGAREIIVGLKASFGVEIDRVGRAIDEMEDAGALGDVSVSILLGPGHYLYGEETGLLEVLAGRAPFPRVTPPYRRGVDGSGTSAEASLATGPGGRGSPPVLVNNVETWANIPDIVVNGPDWFRSVGDPDTPGTLVCTVTGDTATHGVAEFPSGTPLGEIIETIGGGPVDGRSLVAALPGVSMPMIPSEAFGTPLTHGAMRSAGSGLGSASFIVIDDQRDPMAVAAQASRFLAVESCGQCSPCKEDGLAISEILRRADGTAGQGPGSDLADRLRTVTDEARCSLAQQHHDVVQGLLRLMPAVDGRGPDPGSGDTGSRAGTVIVAPLIDVREGRAIVDDTQAEKQPDWTFGGRYGGAWPRQVAGVASGAHAIGVGPASAPHRRDGAAGPTAPSPGQPTPTTPTTGRAGGASTAADDPFRPLRRDHAELGALLDRLETASPTEREQILVHLARVLHRHRTITERVLYPMTRRLAGDTGEDATLVAERRGRRAEALLDVRTDPSVWDGVDLSLLRDEIDEQIAAEDRIIVPILESVLDPDGLADLGEALEASLLTRPGAPD